MKISAKEWKSLSSETKQYLLNRLSTLQTSK